jgi:hypothetical protein
MNWGNFDAKEYVMVPMSKEVDDCFMSSIVVGHTYNISNAQSTLRSPNKYHQEQEVSTCNKTVTSIEADVRKVSLIWHGQ